MYKLKFIGNLLASLLFFLLLNQEAYSQVLIGPKAGLSLGVLSIENQISNASNSYRAGLILGAAIEFRISRFLSIQFEPAYVQKGSSISFDAGFGKVRTKLRFGYLQVPMMIKLRAGNSSIIPYASIGPNIGFLLTAKSQSNMYTPPDSESDVKQNYKQTDSAIDFGFGFEFNTSGSFIISTDLRYSLGVSNIDRSPNGAIKTRCIQILIGTLFPI